MKVKFSIFALLLLALSLLHSSCKDNAIVQGEPGNYSSGVFVVNEGPFGGTGSISWYNPATGESVADVFSRENNGAALGAFVQSLTLIGNKAYIVVNGANKIVVVDAQTFAFEREITGFELPRYILPVENNQAYVSEWGADGISGQLVLVDLNTGAILKRTLVGSGPEKMLRQGDEILVANSGGFGVDYTISTVDVASGEAGVNFLLPVFNAACISKGLNNSSVPLFVARGDWMQANSTGWIGEFKPADFPGFELAQGADDLCLSPDGKRAYCIAGGAIWKYDGNTLEKLVDQACYGLNCDPETGNLYCADPKDFNSNGEVIIRDHSGMETGRFGTGIAPGEVVFIR